MTDPIPKLEDLIEFTDFGQVEAREKFVRDIDPATVKLIKPIGYYRHLPDEVRCGLKDCHQGHFTGLVVLTSENTEGNIGNHCGKTQFGDVFVDMINQVERSERRKTGRERAKRLHQDAPSISKQIEQLIGMEYGSAWVQTSIDALRKFLPSQAAFELADRALRRQDKVYEAVRLTAKEKEARQQTRGAMSWGGRHAEEFKDEPRGQLDGLPIWQTSPHRILTDLRDQLATNLKLDMNSLKPADLTKLATWADDIPKLLADSERLIEDGRRFFKPDNLARLQYLEHLPKDKLPLIRGLEWDYRAGKVKRLVPGR